MVGYQKYQANQVEGSGPLGLILLSYESLYKSLAQAKRAIESEDFVLEAHHTSRAIEAIIELSSSLNMEEGGEVATNLAMLYNYMNKRIHEGMCSQSTEAVDEVIDLVQSLREGWQQLESNQKAKPVQVTNLPPRTAASVSSLPHAYAG